jgi:two-component system, NarL family, sensor histidine kinase UhpB
MKFFNPKAIYIIINLLLFIVGAIVFNDLFISNESILTPQAPLIFFICILALLLFNVFYFFLNYEKLNTPFGEKMQEYLHRYEAINKATHEAIWDYNLIDKTVYYNDTLIKMFGYTFEETKDNNDWWRNNIHPADKERVIQKIDTALEQFIAVWDDEYRFQCKDGSYKIVQDRSYIIRNRKNEALRLIGAMSDVTEQRLGQELQMNKKLNEQKIIGQSILNSFEDDKKKIREELHENVAQVLVAVKTSLAATGGSMKQETVKLAVEYLDDAYAKIRNLSDQLRPATLDYFGLRTTLEETIMAFDEDNNIEIDFTSHNLNEVDIDINKSLLIYRLVHYNLLYIKKIKAKNVNIDVSNKVNIVTIETTAFGDDLLSYDSLSKAHLDIGQIRNLIDLYSGSITVINRTEKESQFLITL